MQNKKIAFYTKLVLRVYLYTNLALFMQIVATPSYEIAAGFLFKNSYIAKIDTPKVGNFITKTILEDFAALEDGKIVVFEPIPDGRPIEIIERDKPDYLTLAQAEPRVSHCKIYLNPDMDYATLRETLIHEYLHCMGYMHNIRNPNDLMYPSLVPGYKEHNIQIYAKKLRNKFYGK